MTMTHLLAFEPALDSVESMFKRFMAPMCFEGEAHTLEMRVDVTEKDNAYTVRADLPGGFSRFSSVHFDGSV
jgi:HSP20 family protein